MVELTAPRTLALLEVDDQPKRIPELLAPAGDHDALVAAVESGADACYLGFRTMNARRQAPNFTEAGFRDAVRFAHLRGVRVYVTLNTLIKEDELKQAIDLAWFALSEGADAIIIHDPGLLRALRHLFPEARLHASTQMGVHNTHHARCLVESGMRRMVLGRELSLFEVAQIKKGCGCEVEVFIHGALCYVYSGLCLFSSMVGGRSGNRGMCAQPCRLPYRFDEASGGEAEVANRYLLSMRDLCAIELLPHLMSVGVDALKIEGRMKSVEYVALVTAVYRRAIDRCALDPSGFVVHDNERELLEEAFSRGFTPGYLAGVRDNELMSYERPNNRGAFLGRVSFIDPIVGWMGFQSNRNVRRGDVIEVWVSKGGRVIQEIDRLRVDDREVETAGQDQRIEVSIAQDRHLIRPGDRVFRVRNRDVQETVREVLNTARREGNVPLEMAVSIHLDEPVVVGLRTPDADIVVDTETIPDPARTHELSKDDVHAQLSRLGGTAYYLTSLDVALAPGVYLSKKALNGIRRAAINRLDDARHPRRPSLEPLEPIDRYLAHRRVPPIRTSPFLVVGVQEVGQALAAAQGGALWVYADWPGVRSRERMEESAILTTASAVRSAGARFALRFSPVTKDDEIDELATLVPMVRESLDAIVVQNLGTAFRLKDEGVQLIADWAIPVMNSLACGAFPDIPFVRYTAPVEMTLDEVRSLHEAIDKPLEYLVHGDVRIGVAEHCTFLADHEGGCGQECADGGGIIDAKGFRFPIEADDRCRAVVYNSRRLSLYEATPQVVSAGIGGLRLELSRYPDDRIRSVTETYASALRALARKEPIPPVTRDMDDSLRRRRTSGHAFRGVR